MNVKSSATKNWWVRSSFMIYDRNEDRGYRFIPSKGSILYIENVNKEGEVLKRRSVDFDDIEEFFNQKMFEIEEDDN